ncbi:MAG: NAD(P)-dependent oxidoreductase [Methanobacteriaceae archaeon]|nr:NAD(P)-dependent oxidoreductase [Methanobacteriaceae archaeon]
MLQKNTLKVGFLGFGEVASTLSEGLMLNGVEVLTCLEGRSQRSVDRAKSRGVRLCETFTELAESSDILLSAVVPAEAVNVARKVGGHVKGVYVDLNNISPGTVKEVFSHLETGRVVDAAIMGGIKNGPKTSIIASGKHAETFAQLNQYGMNIEVIGTETGQASGLKMLRSVYTKGVSALLFEALYAAYQMGVDETLLKYLNKTEGPQFQDSATSRIKSSAYHAQRRQQEMGEVLKFLREYEDPIMTRATCEFFQSLTHKTGEISKKPSDYRDVFIRVDRN